MKTYKAAYDGEAIFGIGNTDEEAMKEAHEWAENFSNMVIITISDGVKEEVDRRGGDIAIEKGEDGVYRTVQDRVKFSELSNELKKYVGDSSHYYVDNDNYVHDEWNSPEITEDDIAEQKTYDENGEL